MSERFPFPRAELRQRTVRGAIVTAAFLVGIDALALAQGLFATRLLGPRAIGLYGVVSTVALTLISLKRIGIDEAFVAQEEEDQEAEFQHAFTLELALSIAIALAIVASAPLVASVYHDHRLLALTVSLGYLPIAFALQAPLWIFFRRMDYKRQRALQAIQPAVAFVVTVPLIAATDVGVWGLVIGQATGYVFAVAAALAVSPYRPALRFQRAVARRYVRFSAPILLTVAAGLVLAQGQILAVKLQLGLAAAGYLTLAVTLTRFIDRADQIVTASIYPAICAIGDRRDALEELFGKSNRATLLWVFPFAAAAILFAPDLVAFLLGSKWRGSVELIQGLAAAGLVTQIAFNWFSFYRARSQTWPQAVETASSTAAFLALAVPGLIVWGVDGFVAGRLAAAGLALCVRWYYVRKLLPGVRLAGVAGAAAVPLLAGAGAALALRLALWGGARSAWQAGLELALFLGVYALTAARRERTLVAELVGALTHA